MEGPRKPTEPLRIDRQGHSSPTGRMHPPNSDDDLIRLDAPDPEDDLFAPPPSASAVATSSATMPLPTVMLPSTTTTTSAHSVSASGVNDTRAVAVTDLDRRVGALLDRLADILGPTRRIQVASLLGSESIREMLPKDAAEAFALPMALDAAGSNLHVHRAKYDDRIFKFGIVGFQSSGKSYLISALFDELNFLPSLDEATTSVVTRIRHPFPHESAQAITVLFHTIEGKREFIAFVNQLNATERLSNPIRFVDHPSEAKITAEYAAKDFFLRCDNPGRDLARYRLINEVHILKESPFLTDYTEIIDLPGLGGPYALLDDTTLQYLDEVDAVLFISSVNHNWVHKDTEIFQAFAGRPNVFKKVFFVLSKVDMPGSPLEKSVRTFHGLLREFVSPNVPPERVFYASAWMGLFRKLQNRGQTANLQNVAKAFTDNDANSFFHIHDATLRERMKATFAPEDGGIKPLRDGLYSFFKTHKRLLQLNEVLVGLRGLLGSVGGDVTAAIEALGRSINRTDAADDREIHWLQHRHDHLLDDARRELANQLGVSPEPVFAAFSVADLKRRILENWPKWVRDLGMTAEPDRPRDRREAVETVAPLVARELATAVCSVVAPTVADMTQTAFDARLDPFENAFPDEIRAGFAAHRSHWPALVYSALRAIVGPRLLSACHPPEGAAEEMDPFRATFAEVVAESVRAALDRLEIELPGALVAAWDALRFLLAGHFAATVEAFYRRHPDAPRPLVESPESLLAALDRLAADVAECTAQAHALDQRVSETLESL